MLFKFTLLIAPLASLALAGEGLHLVNCYNRNVCASRMYYYTNDANAQSTGQPSDISNIGNPSGNVCTQWEGRSVSGYFQSSGVTFTSNIQSDAQSKSVGTYVGSGYNGANWNCYRDNGYGIYAGSSYTSCARLYYCLKA